MYRFLIIILFPPSLAVAQKVDTAYINSNNEPVDKNVATYYVVNEGVGRKFTGTISKFDLSNKLIEKTSYIKGKIEGPYRIFNEEKSLMLKGQYLNNQKAGTWSLVDLKGDVIGMEVYDLKGALLREINLNSIENKIYYNVHEPAQFKGGRKAWNEHVKKNLRFPREATKAKKKGKVLIQFYVMKDGSLMNFETVRSPHSSLSDEAIRVIKAGGDWQPGKINGRLVNSIRVFSVTFNSLMF